MSFDIYVYVLCDLSLFVGNTTIVNGNFIISLAAVLLWIYIHFVIIRWNRSTMKL